MSFSLLSDGSAVQHEQHAAIVPWWSFTKTVLSAAVLSLVRDGLVQLDAAVPDGSFTLRQLLRHEAGLADYGELAEYHAAVARGEAPWTADEMLERLDATRLRYTPGASWRYSNVGCAVFREGSREGILEEEAVHRLMTTLKPEKNDA